MTTFLTILGIGVAALLALAVVVIAAMWWVCRPDGDWER